MLFLQSHPEVIYAALAILEAAIGQFGVHYPVVAKVASYLLPDIDGFVDYLMKKPADVIGIKKP